ncbi:M24 family metallopeptidase [Chloroflexota bacterium]
MAKLEWHNVFSEKERDRRWKLVRDYMQSKGLDCILAMGGGIWHVDNGRFIQAQSLDRYLSGWVSGATIVFPLKGEPVLLGAPFQTVIQWTPETPKEELPWIEDVRVSASAEAIATAIKEKGLGQSRVAVGGGGYVGGAGGPDMLTSTVWNMGAVWSGIVKRIPDCKFENLGNDFFMLASVKGEEEMAMVRRAAAALEEAMIAVVKAVRVGASELDVYKAIINTTWENGAVPSAPYITSGPATTRQAELWQQGLSSPRILEAGDVVNCGTCIFGYVGGVEAQTQLTVAIPPVSKENAECARVSRESYEAGLRALQPGRPFSEVAEAMAAPIERAGDSGIFGGSGPNIHGMNLSARMTASASQTSMRLRNEFYKEYHEKYHAHTEGGSRARPGQAEESILAPGMVFEFEPRCCHGRHLVNIGGTVIVTETGNEELNYMGTRMRMAGEV